MVDQSSRWLHWITGKEIPDGYQFGKVRCRISGGWIGSRKCGRFGCLIKMVQRVKNSTVCLYQSLERILLSWKSYSPDRKGGIHLFSHKPNPYEVLTLNESDEV